MSEMVSDKQFERDVQTARVAMLDERAAIVAWLRGDAEHYIDGVGWHLRKAAERIERGEHLKGGF